MRNRVKIADFDTHREIMHTPKANRAKVHTETNNLKHLFGIIYCICKIVNDEVSKHGLRKSYIWRVPIQQALSIVYAEAVRCTRGEVTKTYLPETQKLINSMNIKNRKAVGGAGEMLFGFLCINP